MLLTVSEVAKELHVNVNYVYELIKAGLLQALKIGSLKVRRETLEQFLKDYDGKDVDEILNGYKEDIQD